MGYHIHDAIIVSTWTTSHIQLAHAKAVELELHPSNITDEVVNGYRCFVVPPDGSKEGWEESDFYEGRRNEFIDWMKTTTPKLYLDYIHVRFGGDEPDDNTRIVTHNGDCACEPLEEDLFKI
jgi:hypothetical protein